MFRVPGHVPHFADASTSQHAGQSGQRMKSGGPGGAGHRVRISGLEIWQIGPDGLIASSEGHFDSADYQRQLEGGVPELR